MIENNFFPLLFAISPVILYCILIYVFIPKEMVCLNRAKRYLIYGLLSPFLVFLFHFLFPQWSTLSDGSLTPIFTYAVIQIGLLEEIVKFITFKYVNSQRKNLKQDLPIATMFYYMTVSAGFALTENIIYLMNYGNIVLLPRATSAIVLHLICGVFAGYFISKAYSLKDPYLNPQGQFEKLVNDYIIIGKYFYYILGIFFATVLHGIYDYNLSIPEILPYTTLLKNITLISGLIIGYFIIRELIQLSREHRKNYFNGTSSKEISSKN